MSSVTEDVDVVLVTSGWLKGLSLNSVFPINETDGHNITDVLVNILS